MASQKEHTPEQGLDNLPTNPRGDLVSSKFLRKTKFRRHSITISQSNTAESLYDAADMRTQESVPSTGNPTLPGTGSTQSLVDSDMTAIEDKSVHSTSAMSMISASPKMVNSSVHSPQLSHATSPTVDGATSISSSPRSSSPDLTIRPPTQSAPDTSFPFSPEELDQAKTLVLDILGWGVDPEYLITSGVSPVAIFRIFSDLNLRLPTNLEVSEEIKTLAYSWGPPPDSSQTVD